MLILALDTATDRGSVALVADAVTVGELTLEAHGTYLTRLTPGVQSLLQETGCRPADLGAVAVSIGPGNFTGLRIGLAAAKTLAWALDCPLVPVPTLEALAAQFPYQSRPIGVVLDAKRGELFWGLYRCPGEAPETLEEPRRLPAADLATRLTPPMMLTGPGLAAVGELRPEKLPPGISLAPPEMRTPRAATVARLARRRLEQGRTVPPEQLTPTYLRPAL